MGQIAVHEFISLDGVFESPSWTFEFGFDPAMGKTLAGVTGGATAILLGRTTFDMFAPAWRDRTVEQDPGAPFFNETTKYVVGKEAPAEEWGPSERLGGYDADAIRRLKDQTEGTIYISGSGQLVVVPQVPAGQPSVSGAHIRLGGGFADVSASVAGSRDTTVATVGSAVGADKVWIGHTVPRGSTVTQVVLDGRVLSDWTSRTTNRGLEVTVPTKAGSHTLVVTAG